MNSNNHNYSRYAAKRKGMLFFYLSLQSNQSPQLQFHTAKNIKAIEIKLRYNLKKVEIVKLLKKILDLLL